MKIYTLEFLFKILELQPEEFSQILLKKETAYNTFEIPKKNGRRLIHGLDAKDGKPLKKLQQNLYRKVLCKQPTAIPAKGFLKGESYLSFLEPHAGNQFFLRLDIHDFFGSFSEKMIRDNLNSFIEDKEALELVFELCTVNKKLPQGAVTSPALSNIMFARLDQRILKYCQALEQNKREQLHREKESWCNASISYTRYADDMLFSSDFFDFRENLAFLHMISRILSEYGFQLNRQKTMMAEKELSMNGYVVGENIRLSKKKTSELRRILYCLKDQEAETYQLNQELMDDPQKILKKIKQFSSETQKGSRTFSDIHKLIWYLGGCRSWIISVLQTEAKFGKEEKNMVTLIRRIECVLDALQAITEDPNRR